jgi:hypothetical protein
LHSREVNAAGAAAQRPAIGAGPHELEKTMQAKLVKFRRLQIADEVIE